MERSHLFTFRIQKIKHKLLIIVVDVTVIISSFFFLHFILYSQKKLFIFALSQEILTDFRIKKIHSIMYKCFHA